MAAAGRLCAISQGRAAAVTLAADNLAIPIRSQTHIDRPLFRGDASRIARVIPC